MVQWLQSSGHDVVHLRDEGLHRLTDAEVLEKAVAENRVVLTFDLDFGEILAAGGYQHASVIIFRLRDSRSNRVISRLGEVLAASADALEELAVIVVEDGRHRLRRLPIN